MEVGLGAESKDEATSNVEVGSGAELKEEATRMKTGGDDTRPSTAPTTYNSIGTEGYSLEVIGSKTPETILINISSDIDNNTKGDLDNNEAMGSAPPMITERLEHLLPTLLTVLSSSHKTNESAGYMDNAAQRN